MMVFFCVSLCTLQFLDILTIPRTVLIPYTRRLNPGTEVIWRTKCVCCRGEFEIVWLVTATEGEKKGQNFPEPTGNKISKNGAIFGTPNVEDLK